MKLAKANVAHRFRCEGGESFSAASFENISVRGGWKFIE
jgi:hypothetical protein